MNKQMSSTAIAAAVYKSHGVDARPLLETKLRFGVAKNICGGSNLPLLLLRKQIYWR